MMKVYEVFSRFYETGAVESEIQQIEVEALPKGTYEKFVDVYMDNLAKSYMLAIKAVRRMQEALRSEK